MKNIDKNFKIKVLALFLISNISTYLLCCETDQSVKSTLNPQLKAFNERPNYIKLKIKGYSLSPEVESNTISILDVNNQIIVPHAFYIKQLPRQYNEILSEHSQMEEYFLIYIHTKYLSKLSPKKAYKIIPYSSDIKIKPRTRRAYELRY